MQNFCQSTSSSVASSITGETVKKILVIEDSAQTRNLFIEWLTAEGFHTIGAENGLVGVQRAQEKLPDLIICDIAMPGLDGYGVLNTLRQDPVTAIIPFIFVTARATWTDLRKAMELGADDYLTKPCSLKELLAAIAARLEKQTALWQRFVASAQQGLEPPPTDTASLATPQSIFPRCPQLTEVFRFIEANYHQPIALCDVAQAVGYSPAYLTNLVRQQTGQSVHRWIVERRMTQALSLLLETEQAVNQIAAKVGYQDACHFSRYFRQLYGLSPQAWRSAHRPLAHHKQDRKN